MQVICLATLRRTAVSACLNSWLKISLDQSQSGRRSQSRIRFLGKHQYLGLQKIGYSGILIVPPVEYDHHHEAERH
jgi:hypothetical protein